MESQTHIRPHWGPTNTQIKAHLGLVVPRQPDGGRCTSLRVGDEEREWEVGKALLFDDRWAPPPSEKPRIPLSVAVLQQLDPRGRQCLKWQVPQGLLLASQQRSKRLAVPVMSS